jgi:glutamate--cysteine ligase
MHAISAEPITSIDQLSAFFARSARPEAGWLVGVEQEKLPVRSDGRPIPYDGPGGVTSLLRALEPAGFVPVKDGNNVIGAARGREEISLEPGLQVELAAPPLATALATRSLLRRHLNELTEAAGPLGIRFVAGGFRPFGSLADVPWLPKRRYDIMREYLPRHGRLAHEMMKRTATVQVNLDFADEADATDKIRTAMGVTSIVTALYASSPIGEGKPNGHLSYRAAVWLEMDEDRCGLLPFVFEPGFDFARYAEWALDVPMFFIARQGQYHPQDGLTFRRFLREGWQGHRATLGDWEMHLSTVFPEVRLKRTIECRGADASFETMAEGLGALWRGLLYDRQARAAAWELVKDASLDERQRLRRDVPRAGLAARLGARPIGPLAVELCQIAAAGLARLPAGRGELPLLDPLLDRAKSGRVPADDMLADFHRLGGDPAKLVDAWEMGRDLGASGPSGPSDDQAASGSPTPAGGVSI